MAILRSAARMLRAHSIKHLVIELRRGQAAEATALIYGARYSCRWRPTSPIGQAGPEAAMGRAAFEKAIAALPADSFQDAHCMPGSDADVRGRRAGLHEAVLYPTAQRVDGHQQASRPPWALADAHHLGRR